MSLVTIAAPGAGVEGSTARTGSARVDDSLGIPVENETTEQPAIFSLPSWGA